MRQNAARRKAIDKLAAGHFGQPWRHAMRAIIAFLSIVLAAPTPPDDSQRGKFYLDPADVAAILCIGQAKLNKLPPREALAFVEKCWVAALPRA